MDSTTYQALTGKTVSESQTARFEMQKKVAKKQLERMLGYPLCPSDWDNQYIERGKTDGCFCWLNDETELEDPDEVENAYRFFRWNPREPYIAIDPATAIHAVKIVQGDVTVKTFEDDEYQPRWINDTDQTPYAKYLKVHAHSTWHGCYYHRHYWPHDEGLLIAVDADWCFETVPLELKQAWAGLIDYSMDDKRDIRSESAGTHSYSRFGKSDPLSTYGDLIESYAGPNRQGGDVGVL